jgi:bifunctional non-homologous end joining protein LigD
MPALYLHKVIHPDDLPSRSKRHHEVQLYDILAMGGDDLRSLPLHLRKTNLEQLLRGQPDGITVAPFESAARSGRT